MRSAASLDVSRPVHQKHTLDRFHLTDGRDKRGLKAGKAAPAIWSFRLFPELLATSKPRRANDWV